MIVKINVSLRDAEHEVIILLIILYNDAGGGLATSAKALAGSCPNILILAMSWSCKRSNLTLKIPLVALN